MRVEIKTVKECRNKAYGNYLQRGKDSALITVSRKLNPDLANYWLTLLHELLHVFFTMVRRQGFRVTDKIEHKIIEKIEDELTETCRKYAGKRKIR